MNYLQLVQRLAEMADTAKPTAVTGQAGASLRLANWVSQAWLEIQNQYRNANFMWSENSGLLMEGQTTYVLDSDVSDVIDGTLRVVDGSSITRPQFVQYKDFADMYRFKTQTGKPSVYTVRPDGKLEFYPVPNSNYNMTYEYFKQPISLVESTDVPDFPEKFHLAIVYKALMHYGEFEEAVDVLSIGNQNWQSYSFRIANECLPDLSLGSPLV